MTRFGQLGALACSAARTTPCLRQLSQSGEARRGIGMLWAEHFFADGDRALQERPRHGVGSERTAPVYRARDAVRAWIGKLVAR
jgi:hypothetical protein